MTEQEFQRALEAVGNLGLAGIARWLEMLSEHAQEAHRCKDGATLLEMIANRLRHIERRHTAQRIHKAAHVKNPAP